MAKFPLATDMVLPITFAEEGVPLTAKPTNEIAAFDSQFVTDEPVPQAFTPPRTSAFTEISCEPFTAILSPFIVKVLFVLKEYPLVILVAPSYK